MTGSAEISPSHRLRRAALGLIFAIAFLITSVGRHIAHGLPPATPGLLVILLIMTVLTVPMVTLAIVTWVRRDWNLPWRVYYTLATVAAEDAFLRRGARIF